MADLATLAIKIENGDVVKATTSLDSLTVAGGKSEAATQRLTRRMALLEIQAREMDAEMQRGGRAMAALEAEARRMDEELNRSARAMALVEIEARKMDAAMTAAKQAAFAAEIRKSAEAEERLAQVMRQTDAQMAASGKAGIASASAIRGAFAALGLGVALREFSQLSDTYTNIHARLGLVTTGTANLAAVQAELFDVSQKTRSSFEATSDLYGKIARNAAQLGVSQRDVLTITETVSKAMIISGGSAESNRAALIQLGQAMASGTLRGDELNSVMEQAPRLAQAIADGLGVTVGQLRAMGKEGQLTSTQVVGALLKMRDTIDREFGAIPTTISGAWEQLRNEILRTVGAANEAGGMSGGIVSAIDAIRAAIPPAFKAVNAFFGGISIWSAEAALSMEKVRQKTAEIQGAFGLMLKARGLPGGDFLIENAAKVLKGAKETREALEAQLKATEANVTAITEMGAVSTVAAPKVKGLVDPAGAKAYAKLMEELRDAVGDVARAQLDADLARSKSVADAMANTQQSLAESELLLAAAQEGTAAYKAQQDEIEILHKLQAEGLTLADDEYEAEKKRLEQIQRTTHAIEDQQKTQKDADEAAKKAAEEIARDNERRVRQMSKEASNIIADALDSLGQKGANIFQSMWDTGKKAVNHMIADILGAKIGEKFGEMMGIGPGAAATKQVAAGAVMLQAAQLQVAAANAMLGARVGGLGETVGGHGGIADASAGGAGSSRLGTAGGYAAIAAGAGLAGYNVGGSLYSTSHGAAGNNVRGALGGAAAGALAGATIGSVVPVIGTAVGAVVGAVVGAIGGLVGAGNAAKQSAHEAAMAVAAFNVSMDALTARNSGDSLKVSIAQVNAERVQLAKAIEDAWSGGDANSDRVKWRTEKLKEMNAQEDAYIEQLTQEAALKSARRIEDYQARRDEATPGNEKEEALAAVYRRLDREREDLILSFGSEIDATEAATLAMADQAFAAEKNKAATEAATGALNAFSTAVRNAPTGFKLDSYIQQFAKGSPFPAPPAAPGQWAPPQRPNFSENATGTVATAPITFNAGAIQINGTNLTADEIASAFIRKLDQTKAATGGINMTRATALELMKATTPPLRA